MSFDGPETDTPRFIPGRFKPGMFSMMSFIARRKLKKQFNSVRLVRGSNQALKQLAGVRGPIIFAMNHSSWWDPLVGIELHKRYFGDREICSPMDAEQLEQFGIFKSIGVFGVDPEDPKSLEVMNDWVGARFEETPKTNMWITPQGRFSDVRETVRPRPGIARIAARHPQATVASLSMEYVFWSDARPECLLQVEHVPVPESPTTAGWLRAITEVMQRNTDDLARHAMTRNPESFRTILGGASSGTHPIYDLWLRMRGRKTAIDLSHRVDEDSAP